MIKAESEIEITDLHRRAARRRFEEDAKQQKNIEEIITGTEPHLNKDANPDAMDDDWIANFFDKCRIVSDNEMQSLWSRVLAGEANTPGTYSKRTVNFVSELDKNEADLFTKLCGFNWMFGNITPLVFDVQSEIYSRHGIDFDALNHLESIGLIQFEAAADLKRLQLPKGIILHYYSIPLCLDMPKDFDNELIIGKVLLTKIGQELAPICGSKPVGGFYEYVKDQWKEYLPTAEKH